MEAAHRHTFVIGAVTLTVHDLAPMRAFYHQVIGLHALTGTADTAVLGVADTPLVTLRQDRAARRREKHEAGLFHTAFLLPTREDLGRWLRDVGEGRLTGAADHLVSEALYLDDPEGNGVEITADRPSAAWHWQDGSVAMANDRIDLPALAASADPAPWPGAPAGTMIGHVHLQVGAMPAADDFYTGLGLEVTRRMPSASFYAADRYHHHLAANVWNSAGAPRRDPSTGLAEVAIHATGAPRVMLDPWGTAFRFTPMTKGRDADRTHIA